MAGRLPPAAGHEPRRVSEHPGHDLDETHAAILYLVLRGGCRIHHLRLTPLPRLDSHAAVS